MDYKSEALKVFEEAKGILGQATVSGEDHTKADKLIEAGKGFMLREAREVELKALMGQAVSMAGAAPPAPAGPPQFKDFAEFWQAVGRAGNVKYRGPLHPALQWVGGEHAEHKDSTGWAQKTTMSEATGATGGFLVPEQFISQVLFVDAEKAPIRAKCTPIAMTARSVKIPVLDQSGTTACQPHWFGGMIAQWTEQQPNTAKPQSDPTWRQIELVAHELCCYTRTRNELVEDAPQSLDSFLRGQMGFPGAINWYEEYAFYQGTGAGQPLGVIPAPATIAVPAQANPPAPATFFTDLVNMLEAFMPVNERSVLWSLHIRHLSDLMLMNGPAGTPSYLWGGAVAGPAATILGYPFIRTEKLPAPGTAGSVLLADWSMYLLGNRQMVTIDTSSHERFQYDETSWRAVHRVDGQPWLSAPITLQDGSTQVSPFIVLSAKTT